MAFPTKLIIFANLLSVFRKGYGARMEAFPDLFPSECESFSDKIHQAEWIFDAALMDALQSHTKTLFRPIGQLTVSDPETRSNFCRVWGDGQQRGNKSKLRLLLAVTKGLPFIMGPLCKPEVNLFFSSHLTTI